MFYFLNRLRNLDNAYCLLHELLAVEVSLANLTELHNSVFHSEDCVVLSNTYVSTWEDNRTTLANDNIASNSLLAVVKLRTEVLRIRIS